MNSMQQALTTYKAAEANVLANKASPQEELIVALWEQTQQQAAEINAMHYKLSVLEFREDIADECSKQEGMSEALVALNKIRYNLH